MNDHDLAQQMSAAIALEHRLTNIEAGWKGAHQTLDSLLALNGEIKGALEERARVLVASDARLEGIVQALGARHEQHEQWHREEHATAAGKSQALSFMDKALLRLVSFGGAALAIYTGLKELR